MKKKTKRLNVYKFEASITIPIDLEIRAKSLEAAEQEVYNCDPIELMFGIGTIPIYPIVNTGIPKLDIANVRLIK